MIIIEEFSISTAFWIAKTEATTSTQVALDAGAITTVSQAILIETR